MIPTLYCLLSMVLVLAPALYPVTLLLREFELVNPIIGFSHQVLGMSHLQPPILQQQKSFSSKSLTFRMNIPTLHSRAFVLLIRNIYSAHRLFEWPRNLSKLEPGLLIFLPSMRQLLLKFLLGNQLGITSTGLISQIAKSHTPK